MILAVVKAIYAIACWACVLYSDMMHCGLASTSPLSQLNEIPGTLRRSLSLPAVLSNVAGKISQLWLEHSISVHQYRGEVWRHVTMVAKFLDLNNREFKQRRRRRQRKRQKSNRFILAKQQLCTCITLFCTFLSRRCSTATWNFLNSRACFMELVDTTQNLLFLFLKYGPFRFNPRKFRHHFINQMKLNKID